MIWMRVLYSLQFLVFVVAPFAYRSARPSMKVFYHRMSRHYAWRRMYVQMLMMFIITFHFYYLQLTGNHYDVLLSSVIAFAMFSQRLTEKVFSTLQHQPTFALAAVLTMGIGFVPHLFPLTITFATILFGAVFFPSRLAKGASFHSLPDLYFRWDLLEENGSTKRSCQKRMYSDSESLVNLLTKEPSLRYMRCAKPNFPRRAEECAIEDAEVLEYLENDAEGLSKRPERPEVDGSPPLPESRENRSRKPASLVCGKPNTPELAEPIREGSPFDSKLGEKTLTKAVKNADA